MSLAAIAAVVGIGLGAAQTGFSIAGFGSQRAAAENIRELELAQIEVAAKIRKAETSYKEQAARRLARARRGEILNVGLQRVGEFASPVKGAETAVGSNLSRELKFSELISNYSADLEQIQRYAANRGFKSNLSRAQSDLIGGVLGGLGTIGSGIGSSGFKQFTSGFGGGSTSAGAFSGPGPGAGPAIRI